MFFKKSNRRFPNLCAYVENAIARRSTTPQEIGGVALTTLSGIGVIGMIVAGAVFQLLIPAIGIGLVATGAAVQGLRMLRDSKRGIDRLDEEAKEATELLQEALERGKLHKSAGDAVTTIMEECARHWSRVRQALDSPFWAGPNLPLHYQNIRAQSANAADRAMDEVVVLLRSELRTPDKGGIVEQLGVDEWVESMFGVKITPPTPPAPLPLSYQPVRHLAEKLKALADNVETLTLEVARDPSIQSEFRAESALDLCINELQSIRSAETELRQNLRS